MWLARKPLDASDIIFIITATYQNFISRSSSKKVLFERFSCWNRSKFFKLKLNTTALNYSSNVDVLNELHFIIL